MVTIKLNPNSKTNPLIYKKETKTFYGSERDIQFSTTYVVKNIATGKEEIFDFKYSTGSEWDPKTQWVYESKNGLSLIISNDEVITNVRIDKYLDGKLGR